jgi:hypothetical protein
LFINENVEVTSGSVPDIKRDVLFKVDDIGIDVGIHITTMPLPPAPPIPQKPDTHDPPELYMPAPPPPPPPVFGMALFPSTPY